MGPLTLPVRSPTGVVALLGSGAIGARALDVLRTAGLEVLAVPASASAPHRPAPPVDAALLVLAYAYSASGCVHATRAAAQGLHGTAILTLMPSGTPAGMQRRALIAGAAGVVLEDDLDRALAVTAHAVMAGQLAVPAALGRHIAPRALSHREKQILGLVAQGRTNREIASTLYLAESTVKTHLSSIFAKLDAHSRAEAAARVTDPELGRGLALADG